MSKKKREALNIEDKYDEVRQLVILGKERGFLAIEEVTEMLPDEISRSPDEVEEVFSLLETQGIELVDDETKERLKVMGGHTPPKPKEGIHKPTVDPLEKTNDPVRMYLREMGTVPLLTRKGEVCIARRIERGERRVLNALARSQFMLAEVHDMGDMIRKGVLSHNLFTDGVNVSKASQEDKDPAKRLVHARKVINAINRCEKKIEAQGKRLRRLKPGGKAQRGTLWDMARERVKVARHLRNLNLIPQQIDLLARTVADSDRKIRRHERNVIQLSAKMRTFRDAHLKRHDT